MKKTLFYFAAFILASLSITSCTKDYDGFSYYRAVSGRWSVAATGIDSNNDSIIDSTELQAIPDSALFVSFVMNGTGSSNAQLGFFDVNQGFKWGLSNMQTSMWVANNGDTATMDLVSVTMNELVLRNKTITIFGNPTWLVLRK